MTLSKRALFTYGVPIDLVILGAGVGLLFPGRPLLLVITFITACALSAWKTTWRGGLTGLFFALLLLMVLFRDDVRAVHVVAFVVFSLAAIGLFLASAERGARSAKAEVKVVSDEALARESARVQQEMEEQLAREREEKERLMAEEAEAHARAQRETEAQLAREREENARMQREIEERAARREAERAAAEQARLQAEREARLAREREAAERAAQLAHEREAAEQAAQLTREREAAESASAERDDVERRAAEEALTTRLEEGRVALEKQMQETLTAERAALTRAYTPPETADKSGLLDRLTTWFAKPQSDRHVNLALKAAGVVASSAKKSRTVDSRPRLLLVEKRRASADLVAPKVRAQGVQIEVVERLIDAVDEIFRFEPHAILIDNELPDFEKVHQAIVQNGPGVPIYTTGHGDLVRPYDVERLVDIARETQSKNAKVLSFPSPRASGEKVPEGRMRGDAYFAECFQCHEPFDANEADWCSCLTTQRTLVCTNCLSCFCKASPGYVEKFWLEAPPGLFESRSSAASRVAIPENSPVDDVRRPLVLVVEPDDQIRHLVQRVCSNLSYGFIHAASGSEGLDLARRYRPDLILCDAFVPELDGREMCRVLKKEPALAQTKMIVMTGIYADLKFSEDARKRFHVDEYLASPVAITEVINVFQKHLEGVTGLPQQENLHVIHRRAIEQVMKEEGEEPDADDLARAALIEHKLVEAPRDPSRHRNPKKAKRPLVLFVDSDENVRLMVRTVASTLRVGFIIASSAQEAMDLVRSHKPDLVLANAVTSKFDGRELSSQIREASGARTRTILMTGLYSDREYRDETSRQFHVDGFVGKPLAIEDLVHVFKKHLLEVPHTM